MTTATQRFQAIQELCRKQGKPTHGNEFLMHAEHLNESLKGNGSEAYQKVREIIQKGRQYINITRP
jgi:hypothetical protein